MAPLNSAQIMESELELIKVLVGKIETRDEIASASHLMDSLRNFSAMPLDQIKYAAWKEYIRTCCDDERITWAEISIFRMTGQISSFFMDGQKVKDAEITSEFKTNVENWVSMLARDELMMFKLTIPVIAVRCGTKSVSPVAATLRAYMQLYKRQVGFAQWTLDYVCEARFHFCRIRGRFQEDLKRRSCSSDHPAAKRLPHSFGGVREVDSSIKVPSKFPSTANIEEQYYSTSSCSSETGDLNTQLPPQRHSEHDQMSKIYQSRNVSRLRSSPHAYTETGEDSSESSTSQDAR